MKYNLIIKWFVQSPISLFGIVLIKFTELGGLHPSCILKLNN